jgi:ATP-dependent Clp protease ATP-binding subunit ClpA
MSRVIQDNIKQPLADELLFGELAKGGHVLVKVKDGELSFDLTPAEKKSKPKGRKRKPKVDEQVD